MAKDTGMVGGMQSQGGGARVVEAPGGGEELVGAEHGPTVEAAAVVEVAKVDLLISRADLGPGAHTLIVAGQPIPAELAGLPRAPRTAPAPEGG